MIPDELIEKALYAYDTTAGPPYSSTAGMKAALEAVAADIWDEAQHATVKALTGPPDVRGFRQILMNPYRKESA